MANSTPDFSGQYEGLSALWQEHQAADWPIAGDTHEGELMTLDTVVAGCVTYYVEERELDAQRVNILKDCLTELENLVSDLEPDAQEYFYRLHRLGELLLDICRPEKISNSSFPNTP